MMRFHRGGLKTDGYQASDEKKPRRAGGLPCRRSMLQDLRGSPLLGL
jgi:hypothetical protein